MSQASTTPQAANDNKPWVLIVDDSRVVRRTLMNALGETFHVLEAGDGAAGWRILRQNARIEVVISDIQMPEMDGYNLICKVRAVEDPALREVPIIVITSAEDEITRERAYACGANDFILKPFQADQLLTCVQTQLGEYRKINGTLAAAATAAVAAPVKPAASAVVPITISDTGPGTVETALEQIDNGLETLRGLKTTSVAPHALTLVMRMLPLLKYCNTKFNLGMDREIAVFQQRIAAVRNAPTTGTAPATAEAKSQ
ncbi:MAG: response regulator [Gammaproteobacteria bacterium]|nr:response regulator [Gammaproteobacteria bacterium]